MPTKRQCKRALELHEESLSKLKAVVGLGIVKVKDAAQRGKQVAENAVAVYVKKLSSKESAALPKYVEINGRGKSKIKVPLQLIEQGEVSLEGDADVSLGKEPI